MDPFVLHVQMDIFQMQEQKIAHNVQQVLDALMEN
jgi:hypothetical protein